MVKNSTGGNKAKGFARKNMIKKDNILRVAHEEGEIYAQAVKVMGGSIASAIDLFGNPLRAHIRGKFRGRSKRDNFISAGTWLLVGLHSWQSETNNSADMRDCDILEVYKDNDKIRLKNTVTNVNWSKFIENDMKTLGLTNDEDNSGIVFTDETTQEYEELISKQVSSSNLNDIIISDDGEEINVDDI